jgi:hypothetical protein
MFPEFLKELPGANGTAGGDARGAQRRIAGDTSHAEATMITNDVV